MHFKKSLFFLSLISCMFLSSSALAAQWGDFTYEFSNSDNTTITITGYSGAGGAVVIPDNITGLPVVTIGPSAFENNTTMTSVTIPNCVTGIEYHAFRYCTELTSVTIPASVTYIGGAAFYGCSLSAAYFLGNAPVMGQGVFVVNASDLIIYYTLGSTGFSNPWCPYWNDFPPPGGYDQDECYTAGIQSGDFVFDAYNGKVRIVKYIGSGGAVEIPDTIDGMPVNSIGGGTTYGSNFLRLWHWGAFLGCTGLTSITIPISVTHISDYAFNGCTGLTSVSIPGNVTSIGQYVFQNCTGLISATIPDGITAIAVGMFDNCTGLTSVTIPASVTSIETAAFRDCTGLTGVTIPGNVTSIGWSAFFGCTGLSTVTIPSSVTSIGWLAFAKCSGLTSINVVANNSAYSSQDGVLFNKAGTKLMQYPAKKNGAAFRIPDGVTSIGSGAFYRCNELTSVTIPGSVTSLYGSLTHTVAVCTMPGPLFCQGGDCYWTSDLDDKSFYNCENLASAYFEGNAPNIAHDYFACYPTDFCCGYAEYGPFYCASGFTVYYRAGATGFTNPWCFTGAGDDCYPALVYGESSSTTTTMTTTTVPAEPCTVEFFPRKLSKMFNTVMQLQAIIIRGDENSSFSRATEIDWGTSNMKALVQAALNKRLIIALVLVNGNNQQVGDMYEVTVGDCTGELPVRMF